MRNKLLMGAALAASFAGVNVAAHADEYSRTVTTTTITTMAPPAPRHEVVPGAREGFVWAPGHYEFRRGEYAWTEGHWMQQRAGYEYREPRWVQRGNGQWVMVGGNWERQWDERQARGRDWDEHRRMRGRDSDGDGVPDRFDRRPYNPNRS